MHVGMMIDRQRLRDEWALLYRLMDGLIAAGDQVTLITPEGDAPPHLEKKDGVELEFAACLEVSLNRLPWMRSQATVRLAEDMNKSMPDVLYLVGREMWNVGLRLARTIERPAALEIWSAGLLAALPRTALSSNIAAFIAFTSPIATRLKKQVDPALVSLLPIGVPCPPRHVPNRSGVEQAISVAVIGGCRDIPAYRAMLGGLSRVIREMPQVQVFMELRGPHAHEVWRIVQYLELSGQVSAISDAAAHRQLFLKCDVLIQPERFGHTRSLTIEAMAHSLPVIAAADDWLDYLMDEQTAALVAVPETEQWSQQLGRILRNRELARKLGESACVFACREHPAASELDGLRQTFSRMISGETYPFSKPTSRV